VLNALWIYKNWFFGIEIDLDAFPNIASAMTLSGFCRRIETIYFFFQNKNAAYIHICEGAPDLERRKTTIW
jgi:formiminoglutamase